MTDVPMTQLAGALRQNALIRFVEHFADLFPGDHLKDLVVDDLGPDRLMAVNGHHVINFGSDSFLGLDQDPRVQHALVHGVEKWGTHNGASRAFASVRANIEAEERLADWLGTEAALIYPSVTLANMGAIPGLIGRQDLLVVDEYAHNSVQEGARLAKASGVRVLTFSHCDPAHLTQVLERAAPYRVAVVAIDGVYSMSGVLPPLGELDHICRRHQAVLYVDDAHATGVLGTNGQGTVFDALGCYDNVFTVGSLSKAFSCMGGFIGCTREFQRLLKMRSNTYIFGGPVPPPYLEAIITVLEILTSGEYALIRGRLDANIHRLVSGAQRLGLAILGGLTPIVSVLVGDEADTLTAGRFLYDRGYYVQSVTFPAVAYHAGVLRIQINANHPREAIDGLLDALASLQHVVTLPGPEEIARQAA